MVKKAGETNVKKAKDTDATANQLVQASHVHTSLIEDYAPLNYLTYSMFVVSDRAIPAVEDGLKPVQRRILYAMRELNLHPKASATKSARVVGDVLGKYHPHGDGSVYDAMVRMSQGFVMRYPLVHGEGNFGSRDGDNAAAYRYTEAKLTPIAEAFLDELNSNTVEFQANYDGKQNEPVSLPARLPFMLLNGASGIAVGLATEIPSHNLREVGAAARTMIDNPKTTFDEFMQFVPGPDFATGSQLISSPADIRKVYEEGRGPLRLRALWKVLGLEEDGTDPKRKKKKKDDWSIVFTQIPQGTSTAAIIKKIAELMDPVPKEKNGKKLPLSAETLRLKKIFNDWIESVTDSSGKDTGPVYLVVTPKDKTIDPQTLAMALFSHTDLEMNFSANFTAIDEDGNPRQHSPFEWLSQWCRYRVNTVRRRLEHEKRYVDRRLHIIAGRLSILDHIREVIDLLISSDEPKKDLMTRFKLDEEQADDVLGITLQQIARLARVRLEEEQAKLLKEQARLAKLLGSDKLLRKQVIIELDADIALFGDERRTLIETASASNTAAVQAVATTVVSHEPIAVAMSERGWIAWKPAKTLEDALVDDYKFKTGDTAVRIVFGLRSADLLILDRQGRGYSLSLNDLGSKPDAAPLSTWFDHGAPMVDMVIGNAEDRFLLAGSGGNGFIIKGSEWSSRMKAGKAMLIIDEAEIPLRPLPIPGKVDGDKERRLVALASDGRGVAYTVDQIKNMPKGKGMALIGLADGCTLLDMALAGDEPVKLRKGDKANVLKAEIIEEVMGPRSSSRKGKALGKGTFDGFEKPIHVAMQDQAPATKAGK
jgi:topoisomerase-4 subunit A